jgi:hypothetical protein
MGKSRRLLSRDPEQVILRQSQESASTNLATADLPVFSMGAGEFVFDYSKQSEVFPSDL